MRELWLFDKLPLAKRSLFTLILLWLPLFASAELLHPVVVDGKPVKTQKNIKDIAVRIRIQIGEKSGTCSGTLIAHDIVLTAGHCFKELRSLPENSDITVTTAFGPRGVLRYEVSPLYRTDIVADGELRAKFAYNDIAILRLKEKVPLKVKPALLPLQDFKPEEAREFLVAGFGLSDRFNRQSKGKLLYAKVRVHEYQDQDATEVIYRLTDGMHCKGDSGGPVFDRQNGRLVLIGINTWGDCYSVSRAEVVSHHLQWIHETMKALQSFIEL